MANWVMRQKVKYTFGFLAIIFVAIGLPLVMAIERALNVPETCSDGLQNQNESGVDCGGVCTFACIEDIEPLEIKWHKAFLLYPGAYDVAATIENKNTFAGSHIVSYRFELYDENGETITSRQGDTFINPGERATIVEGSLRTGDRVAEGLRFGFTNDPTWLQTDPVIVPIRTKRTDLRMLDTEPRLDVELENEDFTNTFYDVYVTAHMFDKDQQIVGVSETYVEQMDPLSEEKVWFSWPAPFRSSMLTECSNVITSTTSIEVLPVDTMLVFDRSGSMNDDGVDPPEPLSTAKDAAVQFVAQLDDSYSVGLVSFATEGKVDQALTREHGYVISALSSLAIGQPDNTQHTNLGDALDQARTALGDIGRTVGGDVVPSVIVVLTDGIASRPLDPETGTDNGYAEEYAAEIAAQIHGAGVELYAIGLGSGVNEEYLRSQIASDPNKYYYAPSADDLAGIYTEIAQVVHREREIVEEICVDREIFVPEVSVRVNTLPTSQ